MSAKSSDATVSAPHPRETMALFGHHDAEQALLSAYRGGRIAHAWLMSGAQGIGKATLAYRMARFVLAHPDPLSAPVQAAAYIQDRVEWRDLRVRFGLRAELFDANATIPSDLQNPANKRNILADDKLKVVFGGKAEVTMFEMTKLVSAHLK